MQILYRLAPLFLFVGCIEAPVFPDFPEGECDAAECTLAADQRVQLENGRDRRVDRPQRSESGDQGPRGEDRMIASDLPERSRRESIAAGVPFHEREISFRAGRGFLLMETEVTQALYEAVMTLNPSAFKSPRLPVEQVSWIDGVHFANALSMAMGLEPAYQLSRSTGATLTERASGFRYPLEREWRLAARCGEETTYAGSDQLDDVAWYWDNSERGTHPVGEKAANACGLFDMSGNVTEWVADEDGPIEGEQPTAERRRALGCSWGNDESACALTERFSGTADLRRDTIGLRLARPIP